MATKDQTFRYQSFTSRISRVNIDVIHKIRHEGDFSSTECTYFYEAVKKRAEMDRTEDFYRFRSDISNQFQSFEQLVHNEENIVAALKKHLQVPNSMAMESLLDLLVQLAKDLQVNFYKHFKEIFLILTNLLKSFKKDPFILEHIFMTLAYLFKFLWRYLIKDIEEVYGYFSVLLHDEERDFIKDFASESFSFLLRKAKDQDTLLDNLFKHLNTSPETAEGLGKVLFEEIKGVNHRFHSVSEKLLPLLFYKLGPWNPSGKKCKLNWQLVEESLEFFMCECLGYTRKEFSSVLWKSLLDSITSVHNACKTCDTDKQRSYCLQLVRLLRLLHQMIRFRNGDFILSVQELGDVLSVLCKHPVDGSLIASTLLPVVSTYLLVSDNQAPSIECLASLVSLPFKRGYPLKELVNFLKPLTKLHIFEKNILPNFTVYCNSHFKSASEEDKCVYVEILVHMILKKSVMRVEDGSQIDKLKLCDLSGSKLGAKCELQSMYEYMLKYLQDAKKDLSKQSQHRIWSYLICLPNICGNKETIRDTLLQLWNGLYKAITNPESSEKRDGMLYIMDDIISILILLSKYDNTISVSDIINWKQVLFLLRTYKDNALVLHLSDIYLSQAKKESWPIICEDTLLELLPLLQPNLGHWSGKVRLLSLHILTIFPVTLPEPEEGIEVKSVFEICLEAEKTPLTLSKYRERIIHLQKLDSSLVHNYLPLGPFNKVPLLYLVGNLYCNLTVLWEKLRNLIASHAQNMDVSEFWTEYKQFLQLAASKSEEMLIKRKFAKDEEDDIESDEEDEINVSSERHFHFQVSSFVNVERMPDFSCFRMELWKTMQLFPEVCENRIDDVGNILLQFLKNEYYEEEDDDQIEFQNIESQKQEEDDIEEEEETNNKPIRRQRATLKTLIVHLQLFTLFNKPVKMKNHSQLLDMYFKFLENPDPEIQTTAFKCLMCFKFKYITPYRDHILNILDGAKFKDEVVLFSLNENTTIVKQEHRKELVQTLLRIMLGKMLAKVKKEGTRKTKGTKRDIIFSFLANCTGEELEFYFNLVFSPITHFVTDNPLQMVQMIKSSLDLSKVLPLKRLRILLMLIDAFMKNLSQKLYFYVPALLKMLLGIYTTVDAILKVSSDVRPSVIATVKSCRQITFQRIIQVFAEFKLYEISEKEVESLFEAVIWPKLINLTNETSQVSSLLKLFDIWSKNQMFLFMLKKEHPEIQGFNPLAQIFLLLNKANIDESIPKLIIGIVHEFLYFGEEVSRKDDEQGEDIDEDEEDMDESDDEEDVVMKDKTLASEEEIEILKKERIDLLLPFLPDIFSYLHHVLQENSTSNQKRGQSVELKILQRISGFIDDKEQCASLCVLLFSFFTRKKKSSLRAEELLLKSAEKLLNVVNDPKQFHQQVSNLFFLINDRNCRRIVCDLFKLVADQPITEILSQLNSWNPTKADEPDYHTVLDAFSTFNEIIQQSTSVDCDLILPVLHNCCFLINSDDMSLRDSAVHCLAVILRQIGKAENSEDLFQSIISKILIPRVKHGLVSKSENVRSEYIAVWSILVEVFPDHSLFQGLCKLKDSNIDSDFFENIRHVQLHKKAIAVRKLKKFLETNTPNGQILTSYFLPIVSRFITDETYGKQNDLVDSSVDALGAICKMLSWKTYYQQLKQYLQLLIKSVSQQKLFVRVISEILRVFHFDLSKSSYKPTTKPVMSNTRINRRFKKRIIKDNLPVEEDEAEVEAAADLAEVKPADKENKVKLDKCPAKLATEIHETVVMEMIPWLHKILSQRVKSETQHKSQRSSYASNQEILRVPLALAMVKLLQTLPHEILQIKLPGVLTRVCYFLKSRSKEIRENARTTLCKISVTLGACYFSFIIKQMKSVLVKGYQRHVLCYSIHKLLVHMAPKLKPGDLLPSLHLIQEIFMEEMFGKVAEEKEVEAITNQVFEAKFKKGPEAFFIVAQFLHTNSLNQLILPLKEMLETTSSKKIASKVSQVLQKVSMGLLINPALSIQTLMIFVHKLTADNLPALEDKKLEEKKEEDKSEYTRPPNCLLLPEDVPRGTIKPKQNKQTNIHILVEFGLHLLVNGLKKLDQSNVEQLELLDPFVSTLTDCLFSKYILVNTYSMRCLIYVLRYPLPSLQTYIRKIANGMFILLKNYASAGAARGHNLELVNVCFKAVTVLVRDISFYSINKDQLQVLLAFCEEDFLDYDRQSTAFTLLKAILSRKIEVDELHELMGKLEEMSITSEIISTRLQSRQLIIQYLMDYPLGKSVNNHIKYYVAQLQFERESGRESALEMIATMIAKFPQTLVSNTAALMFVPLAGCMVDDESEKCRKLSSICIKALVVKVEPQKKEELFTLIMTWFKSKKIQHKSLAAQLVGLFVEIEEQDFIKRLPEVMTLIKDQLNPSIYENVSECLQKDADSCLYRLLNTLGKILKVFPLVRDESWQKDMTEMWDDIENHLEHPHNWIRLISAQLFGILFDAWKPDEVCDILQENNNSQHYLSLDTENKLINLVCLFCDQMRSEYLTDELIMQISKNMLYMGKVFKLLNIKKIIEDGVEDEGDEPTLTLKWLVTKMVKEANEELVSKHEKDTVKRMSVIKWVAALSLEITREQLLCVLPTVMPLLQRESSSEIEDELKTLAEEVLNMIKKKVPIEKFSRIFAAVQSMRQTRRIERKRKKAVQMVVNPAFAVTKKMKKNIDRIKSKKRKNAENIYNLAKPGKGKKQRRK